MVDVGELAILAGRTAATGTRHPRALRDVVAQLEELGLRSLPIALLTAVFSALVMTVQFIVQLTRFGAKEYVGNVVSMSLVRELGPVLTALMVGGRIGAGMTAELGSMKVTEQLDAMRVMCADPIEKLVVPRVVAAAIALPVLTVLVDIVGVASAAFAASVDTKISISYFYSSITEVLDVSDVAGGLVKSLVFGILIGLIACHRGLSTTGGTAGVGRATTQTVVFASIAVIASDFLMTEILLAFGM